MRRPDTPVSYGDCLAVTARAFQLHWRAAPHLDAPPTEDKITGFSYMLAEGDCGILLYSLGRPFCRYLLTMLEEAELYELCGFLNTAIQDGKCLWDGSGRLDIYDPATTMHPAVM